MTMVEATVSLRAERVSVATGLLKMVQRPHVLSPMVRGRAGEPYLYG